MRAGRRAGAGLATAVAVLGVLAGCGSAQPERTAVPDDVLFAAVADLPGVLEAELAYDTDRTTGGDYQGTVVVADDADPLCVLYRVQAILWQGRTTLMGVTVVQGDARYDARDLGREAPYADWLRGRYGPRPGSTELVEPEPPPACR